MKTNLTGILQRKTILHGRFPIPDDRDRSVDELNFFRGDTITFQIQLRDKQDRSSNISDVEEITVTVKENDWDVEPVAVLKLTEAADIVILNAELGVFEVNIRPEITDTFRTVQHVFDVELRFQDGRVATVLREYFIVMRDLSS